MLLINILCLNDYVLVSIGLVVIEALMWLLKKVILNQAHANPGRHAWFLKIVFMRMCVCVCVSAPKAVNN